MRFLVSEVPLYCPRAWRGQLKRLDRLCPSGWLRAVSALTSRLIFLAGVKWSCLRIDEPACPPRLAESKSGRKKRCQVRSTDPFREREFFVDNLLVRIHFIIVMIRWNCPPLGPYSRPSTDPLVTRLSYWSKSGSESLMHKLRNRLRRSGPVQGHLAHKNPPPPLGPP